MAIAATIAVDLVAKTESFKQALQDSSQKIQKLGDDLKSVGQTMTLAVTAPLVGGFVLVSQAIDKQEQALAKMNGVLRATGGEAGVTSDHIRDLAARLQQTTTFGDEVTIAGASVLLTFKGIRNEAGAMNNIFDRTIMVGQDMSALLGTDLQSSMVMLGKAIENPVIGLSALQRVGVSFTDGQKETIKALMESNRTLDAQKLILQALETQLGGTAEALAGTVSGQITQAANNFGDQMERMGKAVEPFRLVMAKATQAAADGLAGMSDNSLALVGVLGAAAAATGPMVLGMGQLVVSLNAALQVQKQLNIALTVNPYVALAAVVAALAAGMIYAYGKSETFREVVGALATKMIEFGKIIVDFVMVPIRGMVTVAEAAFSGVSTIIGTFVGGVATLLKVVLSDDAHAAMISFKDNLTGGVQNAVDTAKQIISELRAPSLDLGVTGSNAAAQEALYGPVIEASRTVATGFEIDFAKVGAAADKVTQEMDKTAAGHIPMQEGMRREIELMQAEAAVIIATTKSREEMWDRINENRAMMVEQTLAGEVLTTAMGALKDMNDIAKDKLSGLGSEALTLGSRFTPLGLLMEVLGEAFETLKPMVESLMEPFKIIGMVLGKALGSVLKALFPVIKMVAIAFTYIGQIFFKIAEWSAKSFGYLIKAIGKAIDAIPFVSAKKVIRAGEALINMGEGFGQAYKDLGAAREEIRGLELPEEKEKEAEAIAKKGADASVETAENTKKIAESMEKIADRPPIVINVTGTNGGTAGGLGEEIAAQLDQYYGRAILREERNLGRIGAF